MMGVELKDPIELVKKTNPNMPFTQHERHGDRLDGFLYQPRPQATGTDFYALGCTFHQSAHRTEIRAKNPFCPIIGVTHIISH
jgi:hypothetical protein